MILVSPEGLQTYSDIANTSYVTCQDKRKLCHSLCQSSQNFIISMAELTALIGVARKCRVL
eukprot:scaffold12566_cov76-Skeletonema_dohrnii-CCMP3373.AAC.3